MKRKKKQNVKVLKGRYLIVDTRDYFNFNAKLYGYGGNYTVSGVQGYDGPKSVFGLGGEAGLNINFKIEGLKIGVGTAGGFGGEFGDYYLFRKNAQREGLISGEYDCPVFFTFSVFPLIAYEFNESTIISTQANIGVPGFFFTEFSIE